MYYNKRYNPNTLFFNKEETFYILESVGCYITNKGYTYAVNADKSPDYDSSIHISECSDEWFSKLSKDDILMMLYHMSITNGVEDA